jgi:UDP-N-acetylmuramoyl-L-alanyl-D-glutamate--2,6-diaminopimelate ligase
LRAAGFKAGLVTTVSAKIGNINYDTGLHTTTPNPFKLQAFLAKMVRKGCTHAVIEATSHGLDQHRVLGCNFKTAIITNITHDHLDYHKTYKKYFLAKAKLVKGAKTAILNKEDKSFAGLKNLAKGKVIAYSPKKEAVLYKELYRTALNNLHLGGDYNWANALACIKTADEMGISQTKTAKALKQFKGLPGRFEILQQGKGKATIILDFAHTPNALENLLKRCRKMEPKRLVVVFGCAGERDCTKRPLMGKFALKLTDSVVLTAEDPRSEKVENINEQIIQGTRKNLRKIPDRSEAIKFAINSFDKAGDLVAITGKGHEQSMCFGKKEHPWSDKKEILKNL